MANLANLRNGVIEMIPDETLFCNLEQTANLEQSVNPEQSANPEQELQRIQTLNKLGLLELGSVPIFEEATQTAAHFLNLPICVFGILDRDRVWFKSAVGLSRIGLMNHLASSRQLSRQDAFCTHVVETQRLLVLADAIADPTFSQNQLVQRYGIRSYLGVPLLTARGDCIGSLAVMGLAPRTFSDQEIAFLELIARWSMSEFERNWLERQQSQYSTIALESLELTAPDSDTRETAGSVKATLLSQMTQELCTPLTSILGMAKVLSQGIYGALSNKQQEYIHIIHNSGQYLLSLVNEIVELGALDDQHNSLNLSPIDIEMLCQQAISTLNQAAQRREQRLQLSVEPGNRIWLLDKDKVRQMLYHLVFSVIQTSSSDSNIRIHVSRKQNALHLSIWSFHPWLGEGLAQVALASNPLFLPSSANRSIARWGQQDDGADPTPDPALAPVAQPADARQTLGLTLSRQLAKLHGGEIVIQGSAEEGYRYVIRLPQLKNQAEQAGTVIN